jgi:hypothetical protein
MGKSTGEERMTPPEQWIWQGYPSHLCVSDKCLFHLSTVVGTYIISTIGDYRPNGHTKPPETIGYERLFETYVFTAGNSCECGCGSTLPKQLDEIDALPANTAPDAQRNHMTLCYKYAKLD